MARDPEHDAGLKKIINSKDKPFHFPLVLFWGLDPSPLSEGILIVIILTSHPRCWFPCHSPFHADTRSEMDPLNRMYCNYSNHSAGLGLVFLLFQMVAKEEGG